MSAGNDNIFARWSRRKQSVRDSETPAPDHEEGAFDKAVAEAGAEPAEQQIENAGAEATEPVEPLPRLEDLTAESDLSAFLRNGVPEALKRAALRKVWSLDPAIRDYVGPSEYAWDFNQPGSMAGFGPLDANDAASEFLATMSGGVRAGLDRVAAPTETPPTPSDAAAASLEQDAGASADAASQDEPPEPSSLQSLSSDQVDGKAEDAEQSDGLSRAAARLRHGGAIPH
jgi:hypothetical protein